MASGTGYGRSRQDNRNSSYNRQTSDDPDTMTLNVVKEFKNFLKNDRQKIQELTLAAIEIKVANIKRAQNPDEYDLDDWKNKLPPGLRECRDATLKMSMAYGSDPNQIIPVIQAKMYGTDPDEDQTENVFNDIAGKLRTLKRELDGGPKPNVFRAVREIKDNDNGRAERLFFSEGHHFIPNLKEYTYDDAHNAIEVIRDTAGELDRDSLIGILKTCRDPEDIRAYFKDAQKKKKSSQRSEYSDDNRRTTSDYRTTDRSSDRKRYDRDWDDNETTSTYVSTRNNRTNGNSSDNNQRGSMSKRF